MRGRTFAQMLRQHPLFAGLLTLQSLFVLLLLADLLYPAAMQEVTLTAADLTRYRAASPEEVLRCEECDRILVRTPESGI